jgi:Protein of unknown function DUF262.
MNEIARMSVRRLTEKKDFFFVPVYQRAFSWTSAEIGQLVTDIADTYRFDEPYYIGSLVVYMRRDKMAEVIDGQQRLTALSILLFVLGNEYHMEGFDNLYIRYEARRDAEEARDRIAKGILKDDTFSSAYRVFTEKLKAIEDISRFTSFLLDKVTVLMTEVPKDIDLNLYFEAMNRHSFQILRSDILRAKGEAVLTDPKEKKVFNLVFEACSHFDRYVEEGMSFKLWNRMFYGEGHSPLFGVDSASWWKMIVTHVEKEEEKDVCSLEEIIEYGSPLKSRECRLIPDSDVHYSITDCANFLLIVANVLGYDFDLDDKKMLSSYDRTDFFSSPEKVREFTYHLLRIRYLFDRCVIKESEKGSFALLEYLDLHEYRASFKDPDANNRCEEILLEFYKKYPSREHLDYLVPLLKKLDETGVPDGGEYLAFLEDFKKDWL